MGVVVIQVTLCDKCPCWTLFIQHTVWVITVLFWLEFVFSVFVRSTTIACNYHHCHHHSVCYCPCPEMHLIRCTLSFDKFHKVFHLKSLRKPPHCNFRVQAFVFGLSFGLGLGLLFMSPWGELRIRRTLHDLYSPYFLPELMVKSMKKARGCFLMLIKNQIYLNWVHFWTWLSVIWLQSMLDTIVETCDGWKFQKDCK